MAGMRVSASISNSEPSRNRTPSPEESGSPFQSEAFQSRQLAVLVYYFDGLGQEVESAPFSLESSTSSASGHLGFGPAINNDTRHAHPEASSRTIDRCVAATDDYHIVPDGHWAGQVDVPQEVDSSAEYPLNALIFPFQPERQRFMRVTTPRKTALKPLLKRS